MSDKCALVEEIDLLILILDFEWRFLVHFLIGSHLHFLVQTCLSKQFGNFTQEIPTDDVDAA